jgi:lipoprotein LpqH
MTIAVGSTTGTDGIGATLTPGDAPTVKTVALGSLDGTAMAWAEGAPGEANATKDGSTYTISGSMAAVDMSDPTNMDETPFEMVIVCP